MGFEEGHSLSKGRPKGSKNKNQSKKKQLLEQLFDDNGGFETLFESINNIEEPKDKAHALLKVMEFFMAKHKTVEHTSDELSNIAQVFFTPTGIEPVTSEKQMEENNQ